MLSCSLLHEQRRLVICHHHFVKLVYLPQELRHSIVFFRPCAAVACLSSGKYMDFCPSTSAITLFRAILLTNRTQQTCHTTPSQYTGICIPRKLLLPMYVIFYLVLPHVIARSNAGTFHFFLISEHVIIPVH